MTRLLASVCSAAEVDLALAGGADLIDLKDPARGALGALTPERQRALVRRVAGRRPVSATVGDLPPEPELLVQAVASTAASGVDMVKVGFFGNDGLLPCVRALATHAAAGVRLVAVLCADRHPDFALLPALEEAGFHGVMLDTAGKGAGSLRRHLPDAALGAFVARGRALGLLTGLAGSLTVEDIAPLTALAPDYLGFRGALCGGDRREALDPRALARVRAALAPLEAVSA